jgi:TatD DNase family protein
MLLNVMKLIDVHAHLESKRFDDDLDEVIDLAEKAGVKVIVNSGTDPQRNRKTLELAEKYDIVKASFGMYPVGDYEDIEGELAWIEEHKDVCVAIGEIGLDFDKGREDFEKQKELFVKMLELAKKMDRPVVIHSRKAELEAVEILEEEKMGKVVMHCFHGSKKLIKRCVENGWSFSIPPNITRLDHFKMLVEMVPIEQLLTETDAPYLSPVAGERNEPANVAVTIKEIAKIKEISEREVSEKIFGNAEKLFGKLQSSSDLN